MMDVPMLAFLLAGFRPISGSRRPTTRTADPGIPLLHSCCGMRLHSADTVGGALPVHTFGAKTVFRTGGDRGCACRAHDLAWSVDGASRSFPSYGDGKVPILPRFPGAEHAGDPEFPGRRRRLSMVVSTADSVPQKASLDRPQRRDGNLPQLFHYVDVALVWTLVHIPCFFWPGIVFCIRRRRVPNARTRTHFELFLILWFPATVCFFIVVGEFMSARYLLLGLPGLYFVAFSQSEGKKLASNTGDGGRTWRVSAIRASAGSGVQLAAAKTTELAMFMYALEPSYCCAGVQPPAHRVRRWPTTRRRSSRRHAPRHRDRSSRQHDDRPADADATESRARQKTGSFK